MLTEPRAAYRPYDYPELLRFRDAIRHSYWLHTEFSYQADVQHYAQAGPEERSLVARSLVAIAQIEVSVKLFWAKVYERFPKPEIAEVGMTFAESEVRHANAYAHLLDLLDLNSLFERWLSEPTPLKERHERLSRILATTRSQAIEEYALGLLLFSSFVEHISLFSQFYALMALNRRGNRFKGISNAIEATSKEENIHGLFGVELFRLLGAELPELRNEAFQERALGLAQELYSTEERLLEWIFAEGESSLINREEVSEFVKDRYNRVLSLHGLPAPFRVEQERLRDTEWFELELLSDKEIDFFNKRSVAYARRLKAFDPAELFGD
jgi:ribonucleoside-diphosphate reductase beta chain